jgi:hypothetical protein
MQEKPHGFSRGMNPYAPFHKPPDVATLTLPTLINHHLHI